MPETNVTGTETAAAYPARKKVFAVRWLINSKMGRWFASEIPKSSVVAPPPAKKNTARERAGSDRTFPEMQQDFLR
jgi:hypothetical protein